MFTDKFNFTGSTPAYSLNETFDVFEQEYTFTAFSFRGENSAFDIPDSRPMEELNLVVVVGDKFFNTDRILFEANNLFVNEVVNWFLLIIIAAIVFVNVYFIILTVSLI